MVWMLIRLDILTFDILVGHIPLLITLVNSLGPDQVQNFVAPDTGWTFLIIYGPAHEN